jgi:hypothetical protein
MTGTSFPRFTPGVILPVMLLLSCFAPPEENEPEDDPNLTPLSVFEDAFTNQKNGIQVTQNGTITRILSDDITGDRHQRFIVRMANDQTLLIAHNIDIGQRVPGIAANDRVKFFGEYEWNSEGGVIHWTHKDPSGAHVDGWIEYKGIKYQ